MPTIYVVEDEALIAMELLDRLPKLGYRVLGHSARGECALREIPELQPDVVLMDVRLAGELDGVETALALEGETNAVIVFLTAYSEALKLVGRSGAFHAVGKPFRPEHLKEVLDAAVAARNPSPES